MKTGIIIIIVVVVFFVLRNKSNKTENSMTEFVRLHSQSESTRHLCYLKIGFQKLNKNGMIKNGEFMTMNIMTFARKFAMIFTQQINIGKKIKLTLLFSMS